MKPAWRKCTSSRSPRPRLWDAADLQPEKQFDQTYIVKDNSVVKLPFGYHPVAAAPGYSLYYLWVLAGEPRNYVLYDDPEHKWVKEAEQAS